ncbi:MAG: murein hydrolase activator EnvC family protein [Albidovulum sp.]
MRWPAVLALCLAALAAPARAEGADPAIPAAEAAADSLRDAVGALREANGATDRVKALTRTITAYEDGLAALRDALRRASVREAEIQKGFDARRGNIGQLLGVMLTMERDPAPLILLHPNGPVGTAQAAMVMSAVAPALQTEAEAMRGQLEELQRLRKLQADTRDTLTRGLVAVQEARAALSQAVQDRTDLPTRFLENPEELTELLASADSLNSFAAGLAGLETDIGAPMEDFAGAMGSLPLPVRGTVLRRAGEADAAGIRRPGLVIATRPAALVTAPWPATIRYRGPLLDYGNVMIVEPAAGYLLVMAGLATVFGETGDVVEAGAPLGLMGGSESEATLFPAEGKDAGGTGRTETLYIELRDGKEPVDPGPWFTETKED